MISKEIDLGVYGHPDWTMNGKPLTRDVALGYVEMLKAARCLVSDPREENGMLVFDSYRITDAYLVGDEQQGHMMVMGIKEP